MSTLLDRPRPPDRRWSPLRPAALAGFYAPLGLTTFVALSAQPIVTFFMGQARFPVESLAVLPVIHGLTFVFRALGLSYLEVVIALLGRRREHFERLRDFACVLALGADRGAHGRSRSRPWPMSGSTRCPGSAWRLTGFALLPIRILAVFPALSVILHVERALLVHARRTRPATSATALEVAAVSAVLALAIYTLDLPGAVAAAVALLAGRLVGVAWLVPPCLRLLRSEPAP